MRRTRICGVEPGEAALPLAGVVCNADTARTHRELLPAGRARTRFERRRHEAACSGVKRASSISSRVAMYISQQCVQSLRARRWASTLHANLGEDDPKTR